MEVGLAFGAFEEVILRDLIPTIDASYRTIPDRDHRAMAGLSMGGMEMLCIALHHEDTFANIASLSGPILQNPSSAQTLAAAFGAPFDVRTAYGGSFADAARFNRRVKLPGMGVGTAEPPEIMLERELFLMTTALVHGHACASIQHSPHCNESVIVW